MHHGKCDGRVAGLCDHPHRGDVATPEDAHWRIAVTAVAGAALVAGSAFAIEKALHIGQKAHEFVVVALLKAVGADGVFLDFLAPRRGIAGFAQQLPRTMVRAICVRLRHQPQGPEQRLAELPHR